jgi:hypothetical protein
MGHAQAIFYTKPSINPALRWIWDMEQRARIKEIVILNHRIRGRDYEGEMTFQA